MPRSNRARRGGRPLPGGERGRFPSSLEPGGVSEVRYAGQVWAVRQVRGNASGRAYRCPGCQHELAASVPHTVVWPVASMRELENRRHWHTPCWAARDRRRPPGSYA